MWILAALVIYGAFFKEDTRKIAMRDQHRLAEQKCSGPESYQLLDRPVLGDDNQLTYILCKRTAQK